MMNKSSFFLKIVNTNMKAVSLTQGRSLLMQCLQALQLLESKLAMSVLWIMIVGAIKQEHLTFMEWMMFFDIF
jgi:hypothetical protein